MKIRCPNCGRMGYLPDHLVPAANSLRCRKCHANFAMPESTLKAIEPRLKDRDPWRGTSLETPVAGRARENPALLRADGFGGGYDEPDTPFRMLGPGDSHYELTIALKDEPGPSSDDWHAVHADVLDPEVPSSDEIEAIDPTDSGLSYLNPSSYRFITSWIRPFFFFLIGFVVLSVILIGFLLMPLLDLGGRPALPLTTHALVIASLGTVSFLLFGLWMVFLSVVQADLARTSSRLGDTTNRERGR